MHSVKILIYSDDQIELKYAVDTINYKETPLILLTQFIGVAGTKAVGNRTFAGFADTVFHISLLGIFPRKTLPAVLNGKYSEVIVQRCFSTFHQGVGSCFVVVFIK